MSPGQFPPGHDHVRAQDQSKKPATPKTRDAHDHDVEVDDGERDADAPSSTDLAVGDCVSAFGPAASNGAVTATTVRITSTGGGSCTGGLGGFCGAGGGFFGGGRRSPAAAGAVAVPKSSARAGAVPATGAPS